MATYKVRYGGSFAPPLTKELLASYEEAAKSASPEVNDIINKLVAMVKLFRQTPDSTLPGTLHPSGHGTIIPLSDEEIKRIWDAVPWEYEIEAYRTVFDKIPAEQKLLRNAAFHLLWFATELCRDREPITNDKL